MVITLVGVVAGIVAIAVLALLLFRPHVALVLLAATFPMNLFAPRLPVPGLNTETLMIGIAFALMLVRYRLRLPPLRISGPPIAFIAVIFMGLLIALPWAREMTTSVKGDTAVWAIFKIAKSITFMALVFFPIYWYFDDARKRLQLLEAISLSLMINTLFTLLDVAVEFNPEGAGSGRAFGLFLDPNGNCQFLSSMMLVSFYLYTRTDLSRMRRYFHLVTYGLTWIAVLATLSRGGWLGAVAGHFIFLLFINRGLAVSAVLTLVLFATVAFPFLPDNVRGRIESTQNAGAVIYNVAGGELLDSSAATRLVYYNIMVDMFVERPIWGHGLYAFSLRTPEWGAKYGMLRRRDPHSLLVRMASEEGLIGIGVFAWMWLTLLWMGRDLWREGGGQERALGAVAWGVVATLGVSNLTASSFLYTKPVAFYFWLIYACVARAYLERYASAHHAQAGELESVPAGRPRFEYGWARELPDEAT